MKILITGATGFIGRNLVPALKAHHHSIVIYTRDVSQAESIFGPGCKYVDRHSLLRNIDGVIHLAGETILQRWTDEAKNRILKSRVDGTRELILQVQSSPVQFFISASAVGYYGSRDNEILTENSGKGEGFLANVCRDWERELLARTNFKVRKAVLRTAPVLGHGGGMLSKILPLFRLGLGAKLGNGKHWMSWVHINDIVNMYVRLVEDDTLVGVFNAASPTPVTNENFTKLLAHTLDRPAVLTVPTFALKLALGEFGATLTESLRVIPQRFLKMDFAYRFPFLDSALDDLLLDKELLMAA